MKNVLKDKLKEVRFDLVEDLRFIKITSIKKMLLNNVGIANGANEVMRGELPPADRCGKPEAWNDTAGGEIAHNQGIEPEWAEKRSHISPVKMS